MEEITVKNLFAHQAYWGHMKSLRNPQFKPYVHTTVHKQDIINLDETLKQIKKAKILLAQFAKDDLLVVCSHELLAGNYQHIRKWKPGMLTNFHHGGLSKMPRVMVVDSVQRNCIAIREAQRCGIQLIGVCDSNCSIPKGLSSIMMNDDSQGAIVLVLNYLLA